jgi:hypothetical protein
LQKITAIAANHSWREKLTATEIAQILHITGDINERFGYQPQIPAEIATNQCVTGALEERS